MIVAIVTSIWIFLFIFITRLVLQHLLLFLSQVYQGLGQLFRSQK